MGKEALRVSTVLAASPQVVYRAWFDASQHAAFTKHSAKLDDFIGGKFTLRDGKITGRNMALEFGRRLVQSWRSADFPRNAPDSRLEVVFESVGAGTRMTVMHSDLPEGFGEPLRAFWGEAYGAPMTDYFGKFATLLANTPPSQAVLPLDDGDDDATEEAPPPKSKLSGKAKARAKARAAREARENALAAELGHPERVSSPRASAKASKAKVAPESRVSESARARPVSAPEPKKATLKFPKDAPSAAKVRPSAKTAPPAEKKPAKHPPKKAAKPAPKKPAAAKATPKKAAKPATKKPAKAPRAAAPKARKSATVATTKSKPKAKAKTPAPKPKPKRA
ncbi:MAG: SRPBCC domain-containing protein [Myxococcales bacterium]|nr:SRPBCC domain-containing protein [Myxococcales bacterium]